MRSHRGTRRWPPPGAPWLRRQPLSRTGTVIRVGRRLRARVRVLPPSWAKCRCTPPKTLSPRPSTNWPASWGRTRCGA
jgi:hypothetical protein